MIILHKRDDGSFVIERGGLPYHVTPQDPIYGEVSAAAEGRQFAFEEAPVSRPLPDLLPISAMQLSAALLIGGKITATEARAFGRAGVVPAAIATAITAAFEAIGKTAQEQQVAMLMLESATEYHRDHPLTPIIGQSLGLDADGLDALWRAAALIA